ncbi:hypothetical protein TRL7639_02773 [Falsiruegeria litorea R37]|uniref:Uncharacterized protein n=1 Tax=Falsiruegeria litorea R37 TaxID=1200284 RepID=A0A1Y5T0V6_9RHOB|nr:hypothetical protein TRL7639_02773 [Falsiruegeria litorea R37]
MFAPHLVEFPFLGVGRQGNLILALELLLLREQSGWFWGDWFPAK